MVYVKCGRGRIRIHIRSFESVWREGLWQTMRQYGVEEKVVRVCEKLYSEVETRVV